MSVASNGKTKGGFPPVPPPPAPVFNPSPSNTTVPQPSYQPISPTTPSAVPESSEVTSPVNEGLTRTAARSHRRTYVAKTAHYRGRSIVAGPTPPYYYSVYAPNGCAWQRAWDGYWYRNVALFAVMKLQLAGLRDVSACRLRLLIARRRIPLGR